MTGAQASWYLNKLPPTFAPTDRIMVSDPMLATGGTIVQVRLPLLPPSPCFLLPPAPDSPLRPTASCFLIPPVPPRS